MDALVPPNPYPGLAMHEPLRHCSTRMLERRVAGGGGTALSIPTPAYMHNASANNRNPCHKMLMCDSDKTPFPGSEQRGSCSGLSTPWDGGLDEYECDENVPLDQTMSAYVEQDVDTIASYAHSTMQSTTHPSVLGHTVPCEDEHNMQAEWSSLPSFPELYEAPIPSSAPTFATLVNQSQDYHQFIPVLEDQHMQYLPTPGSGSYAATPSTAVLKSSDWKEELTTASDRSPFDLQGTIQPMIPMSGSSIPSPPDSARMDSSNISEASTPKQPTPVGVIAPTTGPTSAMASDLHLAPGSSRSNFLPVPGQVSPGDLFVWGLDKHAAQLFIVTGPSGQQRQVFPRLFPRIDKFVRLQDTDAPGNSWFVYRRNYFHLCAAFSLPQCCADQRLYLRHENGGRSDLVQAFGLKLTTTIDDMSGKEVRLVQFTAKRDDGPKWGLDTRKVAPTITDRDSLEYLMPLLDFQNEPQPPPELLDLGTGRRLHRQGEIPVWDDPQEGNGPPGSNTSFTWTRVQFKQATANNGRKKAAQQIFVMRLELLADVRHYKSEQPNWVVVAYRVGDPIVVRGRSPNHYRSGASKGLSGSGGGNGGHADVKGGPGHHSVCPSPFQNGTGPSMPQIPEYPSSGEMGASQVQEPTYYHSHRGRMNGGFVYRSRGGLGSPGLSDPMNGIALTDHALHHQRQYDHRQRRHREQLLTNGASYIAPEGAMDLQRYHNQHAVQVKPEQVDTPRGAVDFTSPPFSIYGQISGVEGHHGYFPDPNVGGPYQEE